MLLVNFLFDTTQSLYSRIFTSWEPTLAFCYPDKFDSSPLDTQMNTTEQFTRYKLRDSRGRTMYLPHYTRALYHCVKSPCVSYSTKRFVFTRLHINGRKVFFFDVTMMFFAFLLRMPTETRQFLFPRKELFQSRDLADRR